MNIVGHIQTSKTSDAFVSKDPNDPLDPFAAAPAAAPTGVPVAVGEAELGLSIGIGPETEFRDSVWELSIGLGGISGSRLGQDM